MSESSVPVLSPLEARVLAVLIEKQLTTPDYYPLTLNALVAGCNQKSSRYPVMNVGEREALDALEALKRRTLVIESYGASGRVMRYAHNAPKVLNIGQAMTALLAVLILRGSQTAAELRGNCDRMYQFADLSSVDAYLEDMATRSAGALALKLPKQPGSREHRWTHLLSGPVAGDAAPAAPPAEAAAGDELSALRAQVAQLSDEVAELRGLVAQLQEALRVAGS
ncbi:MAG TPA: YceH family protein [Burkholderiales bacterium]|nr:YceH family protein [Burkholderiales bacterium]